MSAKLVYKSNLTMVLVGDISIVHGLINQLTAGGHHLLTIDATWTMGMGGCTSQSQLAAGVPASITPPQLFCPVVRSVRTPPQKRSNPLLLTGQIYGYHWVSKLGTPVLGWSLKFD